MTVELLSSTSCHPFPASGLNLPSSTLYPHPGQEGKEILRTKSSSQTSTNTSLGTKNRRCLKKHDPSSSSFSGFNRKSEASTAHSSLTQTSMSTEVEPHQTNSVPHNLMTNECDMTTTSSSGRRNFSSRSHHLPSLELHLCQEDFSSSSMSLFPPLLSSKRSLGHRVSRFIVSSSLTSNMILLIFCTLLISQSFEPTTGEYFYYVL